MSNEGKTFLEGHKVLTGQKADATVKDEYEQQVKSAKEELFRLNKEWKMGDIHLYGDSIRKLKSVIEQLKNKTK